MRALRCTPCCFPRSSSPPVRAAGAWISRSSEVPPTRLGLRRGRHRPPGRRRPTRCAASESCARSTSPAPIRRRSPGARCSAPAAPARSGRAAGGAGPGGSVRPRRSLQGSRRISAVAELDRSAFGFRAYPSADDRLRVLADLPGGEPVPSGHRRHHHRRERRLPALHHAAQGGGAAHGCRGHALRRRAPANHLRRPAARGGAAWPWRDRCSASASRSLAGAATNAYYRRFFDTALIFSLITPEIVLFSVGAVAGARPRRWRRRRRGGWCTRGRWCSGDGDDRPRLGAQEPGPPAASHRPLARRHRGRRGDAAGHGHAERRHRQVVLRSRCSRRGFQMRLTPKGTLPFDTEATMAGAIRHRARRCGATRPWPPPGAVLGTPLYGRTADSLVTLFGYGIAARGAVAVPGHRRRRPRARRHRRRPAQRAGRRACSAPRVGDTRHAGRPARSPGRHGRRRTARLVVRGMVRWLYDYRGQPSVGTVLPVMQRLARQAAADRASLILVKAREDAAVPALAARLRAAVSPARGEQRRRSGRPSSGSGWSTSASSPTSSAA